MNASKVLNNSATAKIGAIDGNVTSVKIWNLLAPSTVAASCGVGSILSKPAFIINVVKETAQKITKAIRGTKIKVQSAIEGEELRVTGKNRDDLQKVIQFIKDMDIDQPLQYVNFRD